MKLLSMFTALLLGSQLAHAAPVVVARPVVTARPVVSTVSRPVAPAVRSTPSRAVQSSEPVTTPATNFLWFNALFGNSERCEKTAAGKCKE